MTLVCLSTSRSSDHIPALNPHSCREGPIFTPEVTEAKLLTLNHLTVLDHAPILNTTALWMQIVHGTNLANKLRAPRLRPPDGPRVQLPGSPLPAPLAWPLGFLHLHDPRTAPPSPGHGG